MTVANSRPALHKLENTALECHSPSVVEPDDVPEQWHNLERSLYQQLDRLRSEVSGARDDMILIVDNMVESAGQSNNLTLAAQVLSLADFLAKVGPTLTGFQMTELRSIVAAIRETSRQA